MMIQNYIVLGLLFRKTVRKGGDKGFGASESAKIVGRLGVDSVFKKVGS